MIGARNNIQVGFNVNGDDVNRRRVMAPERYHSRKSVQSDDDSHRTRRRKKRGYEQISQASKQTKLQRMNDGQRKEYGVEEKYKKGGDKVWQQSFQELLLFKNSTGHCDVPQSYIENPKLGRWANNQRAQYRLMMQGKPSPMSVDRKEALDSECFIWKVIENHRRTKRSIDSDFQRKDPGLEIGEEENNKGTDKVWRHRFQELLLFKNSTGNCDVPQRYSENAKLGRWSNNQRVQYRLMI